MTYAIAHRGLSGSLPENSMSAFEAALPFTTVLEVDIRRTRDGELVCMHDATLLRTHGNDLRVCDLDLDELRELTFDVPTLREVLAVFGAHAGWFLDTKDPDSIVLTELVRVLEEAGIELQTAELLRGGTPLPPGTAAFETTDVESLRAFRAATGAGCVHLVAPKTAAELLGVLDTFGAHADGVVLPQRVADPMVLAALAEHELGSYVFTVNSQSRFEELAAAGASAVFTDEVDRIGPASAA